MSCLLTPVTIGRYKLRNRVVMSALTRSRCSDVTGVPNDLVTQYYAQRSGAGLIITEGVTPSPMGKGYVRTPGIYNDEQMAGWAKIASAIHAGGGLSFMQLMHCGRISHPSMLPGHATPISPSAIKPDGEVFTSTGLKGFIEPRALDTDEIAGIVLEYAQATRRALAAGFDGVELHAASGYLPMQFLSSETNTRADRYGGSAENRIRFVVEILEAMISVAGADRVGIKIAPEMAFNDAKDLDPLETFTTLVTAIAPLGLAFMEVQLFDVAFDYHAVLRPLWPSAYLHGCGLKQTEAEHLITNGLADAVVFGTAFISNPDLIERFRLNEPLKVADPATFFTDGPAGYIDYPLRA
jgi:N-ethylmaleimide reductase